MRALPAQLRSFDRPSRMLMINQFGINTGLNAQPSPRGREHVRDTRSAAGERTTRGAALGLHDVGTAQRLRSGIESVEGRRYRHGLRGAA
ncbi:hypothetical protein [Mycobacterium ostraviense]|uniref:Uncharacterized protein n=1 Tax=Mycobacterium ostraviense TaxID=2738409 RepID=A0A163W1Y8_9MYCO|nr:hypothetical protein [Mycobacterium ostraviense]KZS57913.1 hypothetical protein A4G28_12925 [Mycobacterium ostraviense]UGT91558.1 hypothetical protein LTS72_26025 [Mycobacterium ostraviense]